MTIGTKVRIWLRGRRHPRTGWLKEGGLFLAGRKVHESEVHYVQYA